MFNKPRILLVNEASFLATGYSTYGKAVMEYLNSLGKYELAELSTYASDDDQRLNSIPWKTYPNIPSKNNKSAIEAYNTKHTNQWGEFRFNEVCLDFKPHIVMTVTDVWMNEFILRSPYRRLFNFVNMPPVDANQTSEWLTFYSEADALFTYTDWAAELLKQECGPNINVLGSASPVASQAYRPIKEAEQIKKALGLDGVKIVGTVMRNQPRKLFPMLFKAFREFLDRTNRNDVVLYCHTSYPDQGWKLAKEILKYGLSSKVLFTYVCRETGHAFPSFFSEAAAISPKTGRLTAAFPNVQHGVQPELLAGIYNLFDIYVQYSVCEGFGMPVVEAAACGVPSITINHSGMRDVGKKLGSYMVDPLTFTQEISTDRFLGVPDNNNLIQHLTTYFSLPEGMQKKMKNDFRKKFEEHYSSWEKTAQKWEKYFDSVDVQKYESLWSSPPRIFYPSKEIPQNLSNAQYARFLINNVLGEPERANTLMELRLIKDITYGVTSGGTGGLYYNDQSFMSQQPLHYPFSREDAYKHMGTLCQIRNEWEKRRCQ